jgi:hypothetical protein
MPGSNRHKVPAWCCYSISGLDPGRRPELSVQLMRVRLRLFSRIERNLRHGLQRRTHARK